MRTAHGLYTKHKRGFFILYKTTRAGCTTALVAGSLNLNERFLIVVPTNTIADETVLKDAEKYSDRTNTNIIKIYANHKCVINDEMCKEYPDLKTLPILPLAQKCDECEHFDLCPITEILRYGDVCDGVSLTYHKLVALLIAAESSLNTTADTVLDKIRIIHNTIFDEIHELQYGKSVSLTVFDYSKKEPGIQTGQYLRIIEDFPNIRKVINAFSMLCDERRVSDAIGHIYEDATKDDYFKKKLSITIPNNYCELGAGEDSLKVMIAVYKEIIELTKNRENYNLSMIDILQIYDIMAIATSEKIVVHGIKENKKIKINFVAVDLFFNKLIGSYIKSIQTKSKRIILTSATICSHNYNTYFMKFQSL
jgi:hypothetical protein